MWTLDLARTYETTHTRGRLRLLDERGRERYACAVLELPWRDNERRTSCIPEGAYAIVHHTSPRFGPVLWVQDVPGRSEIVVHAGNTSSDTAGCPLVGERWGTLGGLPAVLNSRVALSALLAALPRGVSHRLVVRSAGLDSLTPFLLSVAAAAAAYYLYKR